MEEAALRTRRLLGALALAAMLAIPSVSAAYVGSLLGTDGGIDGTGNWITDSDGMYFSWDVTQDAGNSWHYSHVFKHPEGETSHFTLELSDGFTANEIFYLQGDVGSVEIGSIDFRVPPPPDPIVPHTAPEPTTLMLLGSGLLGSIAVLRRRRK